MKFYTKKGDEGKTSLYDSQKLISKDDKIFEALGSLDELNSYLGICRSNSKIERVNKHLKNLQEKIFIIQAELSGRTVEPISKAELQELERNVDELGNEVGEIHKFTIYSGNILAAHIDYARALARTAERRAVSIKKKISKKSFAYLNRISSLLFVLARYVNKKEGIKEEHPSY